ncbi:MAG: GFA family protein [Gammaproteobacteria bacterium]|nr:GFA family protein [Gammaproteobacteria bacterium]MDH3534143.1 GFA family protein [Gammaproteobacteria bacterium]
MSKPINGSCLCQKVTYQFQLPEYIFQYCHCSRCRKFTGSAFASNILVDPQQFEWLSGEDQVGRFEHPDAKHFATCFCKNCGSSLPWLSQSGTAVIIPAGTLDEDPGIRPTQNIFWKDRAPWSEAVDALPQHDELQPRKVKS